MASLTQLKAARILNESLMYSDKQLMPKCASDDQRSNSNESLYISNNKGRHKRCVIN